MSNRKRNWTILVSCLIVFFQNIPVSFSQTLEEVDICVYGGTSAGVIAAYTAKSLGKKVLLIEPGRHLGGLTAGGLGYTDIGNKYAVTGLARDFYRRIGAYYDKFEQWIFEPHVAERIFNDYVNAAKINVWYDHRITSASRVDGVIQQIELENSVNPSAASKRECACKNFYGLHI